MKYFLITYGCQMNKSDSERIAAVLENLGYKPASKENEAELILVNMCSVRQSAVDRVYGKIRDFAKLKIKNALVRPADRSRKKLKIILTGCVLNSDKKKFKNKVDLILDIKDLLNWPKTLNLQKNLVFLPWQNYHVSQCKGYLEIKPKYSNNFSAFVPIMTGCNNFCSYCVVPYTRGREVSRPAEEILCEVKNLIEKGVKEIWLLGQNVNRYCSKSKIKNQESRIINFAKLLKMVNEIPGNFWIRFTSPHPKNFSDELIETMAKCQKVTPYLNLPVQSGDDEILKKMNRPYTVLQYKNLVKKIRAAFKKYRKAPHQNKFGTGYSLEKEIAISTDVIVGFPGETEKQFENTVKLFKEIKFDMAYIAQYSPRPGTAAAKLNDDVSLKEKERRYKILTEVLRETVLEKNKGYIGKEVEVLIDETENGFLLGKTRHYKTVKIQLDPKPYTLNANLVGQFVKVKIIDALPWGLKGILK
jgi:tRNA-2-methylthio-N6-dimethylallyladenosine synthase